MMRRVKKSSWAVVVLVLAWPCEVAKAQGEAPLFDSVDENFNPVSMADLIDGRPLVLAVSSCS
jgi:hypothetical protein